MNVKPAWIGHSVPRKEGRDKVTGAAQYIDDLQFADVLHGVTVRSSVPRGRIRAITFEGDVPWHELVVARASDIPGENYVKLIERDQPLLADEFVNHPEEAIVLLAHPDRAVAERARRCVRIDVDPLPSVHTIADALAARTVIWGNDNVFRRYVVRKGDSERAFAAADVIVVEGEYETGAQEQMYIEPQGMVAWMDPEGGVTVCGSLQCPYYVQTALGPVFDLPPEKIRVVQAATGGGFGGKEEYPSIIAAHAALLAWKARRPVKMVYDRVEDVLATTKRHPSRTRHRTAVTRDGRIVAMDVQFVIDGGAYATLSPVVLSRGTIHATGPYRCDHVCVEALAVATNTVPHGAFRGFGAPQSIFALERQLDRVARTLGLDPVELRRRNLLRPGDETAVGQRIAEPIALPALVDRALELSGYAAKRREFDQSNAMGRSNVRKGIGVSVFYHGSGFTGSGEVHLASVADVEAAPDGRLRVLAASTEIGQGTNTIFAQIVAETAGVDPDWVDIAQPDTAAVPNSGPTVASRTTMVVGDLVARATAQIVDTLRRADLLPAAHTPAHWRIACARYLSEHARLAGSAQYEPPLGNAWDDENFRGVAYATYAWAVYVAEVTVDTRTHEVAVADFVAVQEIGRAINPVLAAGQIEGGVTQAIGWALYEDVVWRDGRVANPEMTNYIIPTTVDTPPIRVDFFPAFAGEGASAKGIGELPMDGPAPAILAAVEHAVGTSVSRIPMLPEHLFAATPKVS